MERFPISVFCDRMFSNVIFVGYQCFASMQQGTLTGETCNTKASAKRSFKRVCEKLCIPEHVFIFKD